MMEEQTIIVTGAFFGMLSVILGAFGAHGLKKIVTSEQLNSFETGVKYQMYHAIILIVLGLNGMNSKAIYWSFTLGIFLFSFSIYGLVIAKAFNKKLAFLGPLTPLGGLMLIVGWIMLILEAL